MAGSRLPLLQVNESDTRVLHLIQQIVSNPSDPPKPRVCFHPHQLRPTVKWLCLFVLLVLAFGHDVTAESGVKWHSRFGLGYESVSQGFYVASADTTDAITQAMLETSVLEDIKGLAALGLEWGGLELESGFDQTPNLWRLRLRSDYRTRGPAGSLRVQGTLDRRARYHGEPQLGDDYWLGTLRTRLEHPLSLSHDLWINGSYETALFDSTAKSTQSTHTTTVRTGYSYLFGFMSSVSVGPFIQYREVPDSSALNYQTIGADANLLLLTEKTDLDATARFERRTYRRQNQEGDYTLVEGVIRHKMHLNRSMLLASRTESELYLYRTGDTINPDFWRVETRQMLGASVGELEMLIGPYVGWLIQPNDSLLLREDYFESGVASSLDLIGSQRGSAGLETTLTYRKISHPSDYLSSFWGLRLTFVGDHQLFGPLSVSLFLTSEWEWHAAKEDNSRINLITAGLNYRM